MSITSLLLFKLSAYCRCRVINGPDLQPYLERYYLFSLPFGYRVYLHRFVASDPGRGLHNHPWKRACSLLLSGQYQEVRMADAKHLNVLRKRTIRAGSFNWISDQVFHRVDLVEGKECWTLFWHSRKASAWGFLQQQQQQYAFHDHRQLYESQRDAQWWRTSIRPRNCPAMRSPINNSTAGLLSDSGDARGMQCDHR